MFRYNEENKKEFVQRYLKGERVIDICATYGIPKSTLYNWIKQYRVVTSPDSNLTVTIKEYYLLMKENKKLRIENEILHKSSCSIYASLEEKLPEIERLQKEGDYSVHALCRAFDVRRSTFYHYLFRRPEQTVREKEAEVLKPLIREIFDDTKGRIGAKKIRSILVSRGYTISPERVVKLMNEMDLVCVMKKKHINYNFSEKGKYYPNRLKRKFTQYEPNKVWVSDITRLYINYIPYQLCVIIDLFPRKVIAYKIARSADAELVLDTFKQAYEYRGRPSDLMFHSDLGTQYISYKFKTWLRSERVKLSYSNPGCPYDNAVAESFFRTIKAEEISIRFYKTYEKLIESIDDYMLFYNEKRPHQKLKYLTPNQFEENYYK